MGEEIDTRYTDEIVCPYCGHKHESDGDHGADVGEYECGECERAFAFEPHYSVSYCSWTMEEELATNIRNAERNLRYCGENGNENGVNVYTKQIEGYRARLEKLKGEGVKAEG